MTFNLFTFHNHGTSTFAAEFQKDGQCSDLFLLPTHDCLTRLNYISKYYSTLRSLRNKHTEQFNMQCTAIEEVVYGHTNSQSLPERVWCIGIMCKNTKQKEKLQRQDNNILCCKFFNPRLTGSLYTAGVAASEAGSSSFEGVVTPSVSMYWLCFSLRAFSFFSFAPFFSRFSFFSFFFLDFWTNKQNVNDNSLHLLNNKF